MDASMKQKLQRILDRVEEPVYNTSITDLGIVDGIRHDEENDKLLVFLNFMHPGPKCCAVINGLVLNSIKKLLAEALEDAFPGLSVEYV
jgi:metal-sulfur cluster biosynthetic enzyme